MVDQDVTRSNITRHMYAIFFALSFCIFVYGGYRASEAYKNDIETIFLQWSLISAYKNSKEVNYQNDGRLIDDVLYGGMFGINEEIRGEIRYANLRRFSPSTQCSLLFFRIPNYVSSDLVLLHPYDPYILNDFSRASSKIYLVVPRSNCDTPSLALLFLTNEDSSQQTVEFPVENIGGFLKCNENFLFPLCHSVAKLYTEEQLLFIKKLQASISEQIVDIHGTLVASVPRDILINITERVLPEVSESDDLDKILSVSRKELSRLSRDGFFNFFGLQLSEGLVFVVSFGLIIILSLLIDFEISMLDNYTYGASRQAWIFVDYKNIFQLIMACVLAMLPFLSIVFVGVIIIDYYRPSITAFGFDVSINPLRLDLKYQIAWPSEANALLNMSWSIVVLTVGALVFIVKIGQTSLNLLGIVVRRSIH